MTVDHAAASGNTSGQLGTPGMHDCSGRPHHSPRQKPAVEQPVVRLRREHRIGLVRLATRDPTLDDSDNVADNWLQFTASLGRTSS
jgi:hypothetical protein